MQESSKDLQKGLLAQMHTLARVQQCGFQAFDFALTRSIDGGFAPLYPYEATSEIMVAGQDNVMKVKMTAVVMFERRRTIA